MWETNTYIYSFTSTFYFLTCFTPYIEITSQSEALEIIERAELRCEPFFQSVDESKASIRRKMLTHYGQSLIKGSQDQVDVNFYECEEKLCNDLFPTDERNGKKLYRGKKLREAADSDPLPTDKVRTVFA